MRPLPFNTPSWTPIVSAFSVFSLDVDHGEFQDVAGGIGGLLVLRTEPRGLRKVRAGRRAIHEDGGEGIWFRLNCTRRLIGSLKSKGSRSGSVGEREQTRERDNVAIVRSW
jgi:hypothetical protein